MTRIALIAAAAMLAGGVGVAVAQTPSTSPGASGVQNSRCWDSATKQVRSNPATGSTTGGSASTSSGTTTGSTGTGSSTGSVPSAGAGSSGATSSGTARPVEAMGLPDCKM